MLPYIMLPLFLIMNQMIFSYKRFKRLSEKSKKISFFLIFIFSALRFDVGWDYKNYAMIIESLPAGFTNRLEFFNRVLIRISRDLEFTQFYFIVTSFIIVYFVYKRIKNEQEFFFESFLIFVLFNLFYLSSLGIIRQFCAVSIVFWGSLYLEKSKTKFLIIVFIASLFHNTALIATIFIFIRMIRVNKIVLAISAILPFAMSIILRIIVYEFFPRYGHYLSGEVYGGGVRTSYLAICIFLILLIFKKRITFLNKENEVLYSYVLAGVILFTSISGLGQIASRLSMYFFIFLTLLIPKLLLCFERKSVFIIRALLYLFLFTTYIYTLNLGKYNIKDQFLPYRIFLDKSYSDYK